MKRAASWLVTAAMLLSRPAFYAGFVLAMLLAFDLVRISWAWALLLMATPVLSILLDLAVGLSRHLRDGAIPGENKNP